MKIETKEYILGIIGGCWILFFLLLLIWTKIEAQDLYNTNNITIFIIHTIIYCFGCSIYNIKTFILLCKELFFTVLKD